MTQQLKIAHLDETAVTKIRALEKETGKHIMAFENGPAFAELSSDHLNKVQARKGAGRSISSLR